MIDDWLARIFTSQWLVFLVITLLLLALAEAGFRLGAAARRSDPNAAESHSGSVQGAVLGLLGLLLGFSFAMAVGRYETRRSLAVDEANSIGTTWLRSDFLAGQRQIEVKDLLRRYTALRLGATKEDYDEAEFTKFVADSNEIQEALWSHAAAQATEQPTAISASFITTLNETIDLQSTRLATRDAHVPGAVWLLLIIVSGCSAWASGYASGAGNRRSAFSLIVFPMLIGIVITLISDIDRPRKGLIQVSQKPLEDLYRSMQP